MNVCSHNLLQPNEQGRTSVYICHIQISFSRLDWLWKNCLQSNFTFVLRTLGVARILYRREWHPTSYSAFMWRCRRLSRICVHNLPSGFLLNYKRADSILLFHHVIVSIAVLVYIDFYFMMLANDVQLLIVFWLPLL